jgi:hypothetical protein
LRPSRTTSPTPSRRGLDPVLSGVPRQEAKGASLGLRADDGAEDRGAVAVLRGVVRHVDGGVRVRGRLGEGDATFDAAGPDPAGAAGLRPTERGVAGSVDRADRQVVASPHHPDGHVRALGAIGLGRANLQHSGRESAAREYSSKIQQRGHASAIP